MEKNGNYDPIANPDAIKGGTYKTWGASFPNSLNMWLDYNSFSVTIMELLFEPLASLHSTKNDPIGIYRAHLTKEKIASKKELDAIDDQVEEVVQAAVQFAESSPEPAMEELFTDIYVD